MRDVSILANMQKEIHVQQTSDVFEIWVKIRSLNVNPKMKKFEEEK